MDIVFNPEQWREQASRHNAAPAPLDWHGLSARLVAADACRRALAGSRAMATGSFDSAMARVIAAQPEAGFPTPAGGSQATGESTINPIASAAGKTVAAKSGVETGNDSSGDRGWQ
ncbi:MAG: hypothetical protein JSS36_12490 [Proteobacteria bacterium]|nr:hypothetical protein [Pseudomonadota bacterium]